MDVREQVDRIMERNEESRRQTEQAAASNRIMELQREATQRQMMDRLSSIGRTAVGAAGLIGAGVYAAGAGAMPMMGMGAAVAGAHTYGFRQQLAHSIGMGGGLTGSGPQTYGQFGSSLYAGRSFGGLLYEAGLGQTLNAATLGMFFQDANRNVGLDPAMTQQLASSELTARLRQAGQSFLYGLPFGSRAFGPGGVTAVRTQRDLAQRLSGYSFQDGLIGGRGISANDKRLAAITDPITNRINSLNDEMGFSLTKEQAGDITGAATGLLSSGELASMVRTGDGSKMKRAVENVRGLISALRIDTKEAVQLSKEFEQFGDEAAAQAGGFAARMTGGGMAGTYSGVALALADRSARREAAALGISGQRDQGMYAQAAITRRLGVFHQFDNNRGAASMFGANAEQATEEYLNISRQAGLGYAGSSAGRAALYQSGAAAQMLSGGTMMDHLGAQSRALLGNPFAEMSFRFDPKRQLDAQLTGSDLAYREAQASAEYASRFFGGIRGWDSRAFALGQYVRTTGATDSEAMRAFELNRQRDDAFKKAADANGTKATPAQLAALSSQASMIDPTLTGDPDRIAKLFNEVGVNPNRMQLLQAIAKTSPDMRGLVKDERKYAYGGSGGIGGASYPYPIDDGADISGESLQGQISVMKRQGMTDATIEQYLKEGFGSDVVSSRKVRVNDGELQFTGDDGKSWSRATGELLGSNSAQRTLMRGAHYGMQRLYNAPATGRLARNIDSETLAAAGLNNLLELVNMNGPKTPLQQQVSGLLRDDGTLDISQMSETQRRTAIDAARLEDPSLANAPDHYVLRQKSRGAALAVAAAHARNVLPNVDPLKPRGNANEPIYVKWIGAAPAMGDAK